MAGIKDISSVWKNIKEIDLKPIRDSATHPVKIAIVGGQGAGRHTLAEQMRTDPARPGARTQTAILFPSMEAAAEAPSAHLTIIIADATREDFSLEQALVKSWFEAGKNVLVFINKIDLIETRPPIDAGLGWQATKVLIGSATDIVYLQQEFVPAVLELLPQQHLALGRQFPLFRLPIGKQIINDTCFSNAAYSFSTGLAEIVPVLDIPLNVTDMIVLTKSQAFLAYRLGLLVGFSTRWQDYVTEFGSVIGGGFLWRQIARQMIGLIPAWGIIPKVAVAYSGTYVVGNAILSWYLTGKHLSPKQLRALSMQAFSRGKDVARKLGEKFPKPRLGRRRKTQLLEPGNIPGRNESDLIIKTEPVKSRNTAAPMEGEPTESKHDAGTLMTGVPEKRPQLRKKRETPWHRRNTESGPSEMRICSQCGKSSAPDAGFCQYCGARFES